MTVKVLAVSNSDVRQELSRVLKISALYYSNLLNDFFSDLVSNYLVTPDNPIYFELAFPISHKLIYIPNHLLSDTQFHKIAAFFLQEAFDI